MIFPLLFILALVLIILAGYWYESTPWRYCPRCGYYWNMNTGKQQNYMPNECDGICKQRVCEECEK